MSLLDRVRGQALRRGLLQFTAGAVVAAVLVPLAGLMAGVLDPPAHPLTGPVSFSELFGRSRAAELFARTGALAVIVAAVACALGAWLAWVEQRYEYPGRRALAVADLLPLAIPSYVLAAAVRSQLGPAGFLGSTLGVERFDGFWAAVLVLSLVTVPYVHLLVGAALARMSSAEEDAARTLGASPSRVFSAVVLPRLRPALAFSFLITQLYVVSDFGAVAVLNCRVLTWRLFQAVNHQQLDRAALLGAVLLALTVPLLMMSRWIRGDARDAGHVANPRPPLRRPPGRAAMTAIVVAHLLVIGLGVALPVATLGGWVADGLRHGEVFAPVWQPFRDTVVVAVSCSLIIVVLAYAPAWVAARRYGRFARFVEIGVWFTGALPGVLLAFGFLLAALHSARALGLGAAGYDAAVAGGGLLLLGYLSRFLTEAYAAVKTSILQLDPRGRETARVLGASAGRWFVRVALPALAPGTAAAVVLVVLALVKELPITLILGGAMGLRTLAFRMFDRYQEAFLHDAGLAGLLIIVLALSAVTAAIRWRRHV